VVGWVFCFGLGGVGIKNIHLNWFKNFVNFNLIWV